MRMLWRGMLQWRLPTANQQEGRTFAAAVIPAAHSTFVEACARFPSCLRVPAAEREGPLHSANMLKNFPNVWTLHIRKDSIAAAREYAAQNRMVIVQIAAITPDMMPNAPAAVLDKAGHPAAGGGNSGGFAYLLQGLLTNGMVRLPPTSLIRPCTDLAVDRAHRSPSSAQKMVVAPSSFLTPGVAR